MNGRHFQGIAWPWPPEPAIPLDHILVPRDLAAEIVSAIGDLRDDAGHLTPANARAQRLALALAALLGDAP